VKLDALHELQTASLRALAASLLEGSLSVGITGFAVQQIAGANARRLEACLQDLQRSGIDSNATALLATAIADARGMSVDAASLFELVLSGPELDGVPTSDTAATMRALVAQAQSEILLVGYAVHNGKVLFGPVGERLERNPGLKVRLCLDIRREWGDHAPDSEIVRRYTEELRSKHWPSSVLPELYFDRRALSTEADRASLHAKCVIVDRKAALVTSANFTEAAQRRNIEAGVLIRHVPSAARLAEYFNGLIASGLLARCLL
jgi:phosphatidylserine/phosphatidylglycerophosphate/cardiolipin synthase-like enzyme